MGKRWEKVKTSMNAMWYFQSKPLAIISLIVVLTFIAVNNVIFVHDYGYWIRSYQFVLSAVLLSSIVTIVIYWHRKDRPHPQSEEVEEAFKMLTLPMVGMTVLMAVGSVLGYLHIFYFTTVFSDCDMAVEADNLWQLASDYLFYIVIMVAFLVYPTFIFRCYWVPMSHRWRWILFLVTTILVVLFFHISLEEAFHTYVHLCDNTFVLKNNWCPTVIQRHSYQCSRENFTEVQELWINMEEQVVGPGIFLFISEYIPLLFVLIWMAPVEDQAGKSHSTLRHFHDMTEDSFSQDSPTLQHLQHGMQEVDLIDSNGRRTLPYSHERLVPNTSKCTEIVIISIGICMLILSLVRLGLSLNHVGRHPRAELMLEAVGHMMFSSGETVFYGVAYFLWLRHWSSRNIRRSLRIHKQTSNDEANEEEDHEIEHHIIHAKFDTFLLRVASFIFTVQILVSGVAELDFTSWAGPFYLLHKIPVLLSIWFQYLCVSKAFLPTTFHWNLSGQKAALVFSLVAMSANFFEWVAQFVKRRFMVYILESGVEVSSVAVVSIAISEILYPALSFFYFHALLCWLVVMWRVIRK